MGTAGPLRDIHRFIQQYLMLWVTQQQLILRSTFHHMPMSFHQVIPVLLMPQNPFQHILTQSQQVIRAHFMLQFTLLRDILTLPVTLPCTLKLRATRMPTHRNTCLNLMFQGTSQCIPPLLLHPMGTDPNMSWHTLI